MQMNLSVSAPTLLHWHQNGKRTWDFWLKLKCLKLIFEVLFNSIQFSEGVWGAVTVIFSTLYTQLLKWKYVEYIYFNIYLKEDITLSHLSGWIPTVGKNQSLKTDNEFPSTYVLVQQLNLFSLLDDLNAAYDTCCIHTQTDWQKEVLYNNKYWF